MSVKSKHLLLISDNKGSVRVSFIFRVRVNTAVYLYLRKKVWGTLHDINFLYTLTRVILKLWRRARGHFVTLIKIGVHLITCNPGHISYKWETVFRLVAIPNDWSHAHCFVIFLLNYARLLQIQQRTDWNQSPLNFFHQTARFSY